MNIKYLFIILTVIVFYSCGPSTEEIFEEDTTEIIGYLNDNGLLDDASVTSTGLYYIIHEAGNSTYPGLNDFVKCNYKGYIPSGDVFDANDGITFTLGGTIEGWRQGIPLIGEGGTIQLFVPSKLGYGTSGTTGIDANQVLIFDVDLIKVN